MSVPISKRSISSVLFLQALRDMRKRTILCVKKLPKSYHHLITDGMLKLAQDACIQATEANSIYLHEKMDKADFQKRHDLFLQSYLSVSALSAEISFLFEVLPLGTFGTEAETEKSFNLWVSTVLNAKTKLKAIMVADKDKWKSWKMESV